jgi:hypothetical protein
MLSSSPSICSIYSSVRPAKLTRMNTSVHKRRVKLWWKWDERIYREWCSWWSSYQFPTLRLVGIASISYTYVPCFCFSAVPSLKCPLSWLKQNAKYTDGPSEALSETWKCVSMNASLRSKKDYVATGQMNISVGTWIKHSHLQKGKKFSAF